MGERLDCSGLACPEPVLRTKQALERMTHGTLVVRVDDPAARDNVRRFAESQGCTVTVTQTGADTWDLEVTKGGPCATGSVTPGTTETAPGPLALLVVSDRIGPEPDLGELLLRSFLGTLVQAASRPARMLFLNRGVHLTTEGSPALDVLQDLAAAGVEIFSCGTCLEYFGKKDKVRVGRVASMYDTVETLTGPFRTVTVG